MREIVKRGANVNFRLPKGAPKQPATSSGMGAVAGMSGNGHRTVSTFEEVVTELEADGIVLRDVAQGLVDFPARAPAGRGYWLCWLVGEPEVAWWHWPEDGFAGRRPLSEPPK